MYAIPGCAPIMLDSQPIMLPFFFSCWWLDSRSWKLIDAPIICAHLWQGFIYISFIILWLPFTQVCSHISAKNVMSSTEIHHEILNRSFSRAQNKPTWLFKYALNVHLQVWVGGEATGLLSSLEYKSSWTILEVWKVLADISLFCLN